MAVVMRGWSRTASTAAKLAMAERIIGYQFKDVDRLYEALDQKKQPISLSSGRKRTRNTPLALVGDAHAKLYVAQKWYDNPDLTGFNWQEITSTLSNDHLGEVGFKLGLDECAISGSIETRYDMATTVEAMFAAMKMDGASQEQHHKVMDRFGLQHKLIDPIHRAWIHHAVKSTLGLPDRFFIGHHFKLQEGIFETQMKRRTAREQKIGSQVRVKGFWRKLAQLALKSATRSPEIAEPPAGGPRSTATETIITTGQDVATGETAKLSKESLGRLEDDERAAAPEQATDKEDPVQKHEAAESSPLAKPTPSRAPKEQPQPVLTKKGTSAGDRVQTGNGSQDSNKASRDKPAPDPSSKDGAATGAELAVAHQPHEASGAELVEATEAGNPQKSLEQKLEELKKRAEELKTGKTRMAQESHQPHEASGAEPVEAMDGGISQRSLDLTLKTLKAKYVKMEREFQKIRQAGKKVPPEQRLKLVELYKRRQRLRERLWLLKKSKNQS